MRRLVLSGSTDLALGLGAFSGAVETSLESAGLDPARVPADLCRAGIDSYELAHPCSSDADALARLCDTDASDAGRCGQGLGVSRGSRECGHVNVPAVTTSIAARQASHVSSRLSSQLASRGSSPASITPATHPPSPGPRSLGSLSTIFWLNGYLPHFSSQ